ncbi:hypothetical protein H671_3g10878 [Cricetulus griseus]|nr:hypothetical protein H671_3g10878 [Cricetulus griseus]
MRIRDPAGGRAPAARLVAPVRPPSRVRLRDSDPSGNALWPSRVGRTAAVPAPTHRLPRSDVLFGRWEGLASVLRPQAQSQANNNYINAKNSLL